MFRKRPREPQNEAEIKPCRHMACWVNGLSDGSLSGWARWYTKLHVSGCTRCQQALEALIALQLRLRALGNASDPSETPALSSDRRAALDAALDARDTQHGSKS